MFIRKIPSLAQVHPSTIFTLSLIVMVDMYAKRNRHSAFNGIEVRRMGWGVFFRPYAIKMFSADLYPGYDISDDHEADLLTVSMLDLSLSDAVGSGLRVLINSRCG
jgi:hypothetical protein